MHSRDVNTEMAVIGGGPAGLAAAKEAGRLGTKVVLVELDQPGGRALWHSLVPSKVWLAAANLLDDLTAANRLGLKGSQAHADLEQILERLQKVKHREDQRNHRFFKQYGIEVISGTGSFIDEHTIRVEDEDKKVAAVHADRIIIASGSIPIFPPNLKPDGKRILAPRFMSKLPELPKSIVVVGGGVTGSEVIFLFNSLGTKVTAVTDIDTLLPRSDRDISDFLEQSFRERGVIFQKNNPVQQIENHGDHVVVRSANSKPIETEYAFVAIGRKPDLRFLNIEKAGLEPSPEGAIAVDVKCRTSVPHIYAAGDVTGAPMLANRAIQQGRIAARNAASRKEESYNHNWSVEAIYTRPEVAQVGLTEISAAENDQKYNVVRFDFSENLKANITDHHHGFVKILSEPQSNQILGASAVGDHTADLLAPIAVAIRGKLTLEELRQTSPANPTLSELLTSMDNLAV